MKQQSGSKRLSTFARYVVSYMLVLLLALSARSCTCTST